MTFIKPANITYTYMAQWVDEHAVSPECNEELLCQYLYHIVCTHAQQLKLCQSYEQLDDFALYCATRLFSKFRTPQKNTTSIKSITNYVKSVVSAWKADYVREFCTGSAEGDLADFDPLDFGDYLVDATTVYNSNMFYTDTLKVADIARRYLQNIPRKRKSPEWTNIYISCLLTLEDRIKQAQKLSTAELAVKQPRLVNMLIRSLRRAEPILFHLPENKANYITTLVNELTHAIAVEISYTIGSKVSVSACLRNMIVAANNEEDE